MSLDPRFAELMNHVIDGVASTDESAKLQSHLASHAEAGEEFARLKKLSGVLGRIGAVEPPPGFTQSVLASLPASRRERAARSKEPARRPWGSGRSLLQYGYAMAAGLLLGVAVAHWSGLGGQDSRSLDPSALAGSMTSREASGAALILETALESSRVKGTVQVRHAEAGYLIALDLDASGTVQVVLGYEPERAAFRGFAQEIDAVQGLVVTADTVSWSQSGHRRTTVVMTPRTGSGTRVDLRIEADGVAAGGGTLDLPAQGEPAP